MFSIIITHIRVLFCSSQLFLHSCCCAQHQLNVPENVHANVVARSRYENQLGETHVSTETCPDQSHAHRKQAGERRNPINCAFSRLHEEHICARIQSKTYFLYPYFPSCSNSRFASSFVCCNTHKHTQTHGRTYIHSMEHRKSIARTRIPLHLVVYTHQPHSTHQNRTQPLLHGCHDV